MIALGALFTGNAGTYYAALETVPVALAGVLVYLYPAIVAVLSIRYATRLAGRRPSIALGIALVGVVLALGGIDLATPPPAGGIALILASPLIYAGSRRIGAAQAALVSTIEPVVIVALAWIALRETLAPIQLIGAGLIIIAVLVAQTADRPSGAPEPASPLDAEVSAGN